MGTSQIILLTLLGIRLLANAHMHGKDRTGKHNFFIAAFDVALMLWILIAGGFFG